MSARLKSCHSPKILPLYKADASGLDATQTALVHSGVECICVYCNAILIICLRQGCLAGLGVLVQLFSAFALQLPEFFAANLRRMHKQTHEPVQLHALTNEVDLATDR